MDLRFVPRAPPRHFLAAGGASGARGCSGRPTILTMRDKHFDINIKLCYGYAYIAIMYRTIQYLRYTGIAHDAGGQCRISTKPSSKASTGLQIRLGINRNMVFATTQSDTSLTILESDHVEVLVDGCCKNNRASCVASAGFAITRLPSHATARPSFVDASRVPPPSALTTSSCSSSITVVCQHQVTIMHS